jgi:rsbT antagonist protein RsbS
MQVHRDIVVAFVQVDLDERVIASFQCDLLSLIRETGSRGAIIDLSGLETIDSDEFAALRQVVAAARIMGSEPVLVGLRPGVVSSLVDSGANVEGLRAAVSLDAAFALFESPGQAEDDAADGLVDEEPAIGDEDNEASFVIAPGAPEQSS